MVENGTLIEKIEKHPRIWCTVAAIITLICIAGGVFLFAVRPSFKASKIEKAPYFGHVKCEITEHFADEDFEIRNSFCRYIPTGNDYFYRICTEDGAWIIVRGDKNEDLSVGKNIEGRVRKFNKEEIKDEFEGEEEILEDVFADEEGAAADDAETVKEAAEEITEIDDEEEE